MIVILSGAQSKDPRLPFGALPVELALAIARGIAEGLGAAHMKGMVHRDIKPENILMAREGGAWVPKIADFGIVATKESSSVYTRTGGTLLTMAYAAPEQWRGAPASELDGRTDLYALGGVLYEMLTGQTPFQAENYEGWARKHQTTPPPPPSTLRPDLAAWQGLDALVLRLLAKAREDRPKDVAGLLGSLDAVRYLAPDTRRMTAEDGIDLSNGSRRAAKASKTIHRKILFLGLLASLPILIAVAVWYNSHEMEQHGKNDLTKFTPPEIETPTGSVAQPGKPEVDYESQAKKHGGTSAMADTEKNAEALCKNGHYSEASRLFLQACEGGLGRACERLSDLYSLGHGAAQYSAAELALSKACDGGKTKACTHLADLYMGGPKDAHRYSRVVPLLTKTCNEGDSEGCTELGWAYGLGVGTPVDYPREANLFSKACDAGNAEGCSALGFMCAGGEGINQDLERAKQLYRKACSLGDQSACNDLKKLK